MAAHPAMEALPAMEAHPAMQAHPAIEAPPLEEGYARTHADYDPYTVYADEAPAESQVAREEAVSQPTLFGHMDIWRLLSLVAYGLCLPFDIFIVITSSEHAMHLFRVIGETVLDVAATAVVGGVAIVLAATLLMQEGALADVKDAAVGAGDRGAPPPQRFQVARVLPPVIEPASQNTQESDGTIPEYILSPALKTFPQ